MSTQTVDETQATLPDGISLDNTDLSEEEKERAIDIFIKWNGVFSKDLKGIGHTKLVDHHIKLSNEEPFKEPYRRIPPALKEEVREHIQEMLQAGAIRSSESHYSSNVVIVRKKNGSIRFCVDFRKLNSRTISDAYAIHRIDDSPSANRNQVFFRITWSPLRLLAG